ncbi:hypothetical protein I4U23_006207 [Adineta vaga]|nr:hypothetical protein I4U23_006207 [Adineta vaga]
MYNITKSNVLLISILLIFTTTGVFSDCLYSQRSCYKGFDSWCCSYDETCGTSYGMCEDSSSLPPAVIAVIIIVAIFICVTCLSCCIQSNQRQQQLRAAIANPHTRFQTTPYQNNLAGTPVRVIHVRPVSCVRTAPLVQTHPSLYEAPPPPYEIATATSPSVHQLAISPPITATVEQIGSSNV